MLIRKATNRLDRTAAAWLAALLLAVALIAFAWATPAWAAGETHVTPLLAYYSLSYEPDAWGAGNTDIPLLGRYSSDDASVMREQIRVAQKAGIDGFIVNWKNTTKLNARLEQLLETADGEGFKLAINYQGPDAQSKPMAAKKVATDLDYFQRNMTGHAALALFDKPLIIWSGIDTYSAGDVTSVTATRRRRLLILAAVSDLEQYQAISEHVDGNAYYWSSPNPEADGDYAGRLVAFGKAVHAGSGLWVAPVAPGFGSPGAGADRVVDRKDGATLVKELNAATASGPDAIGLISWNVFKDNTQVEPSARYGTHYLDVLAEARGVTGPIVIDFDSSEPGDPKARPANMATLGGMALLFLASVGAIIVRNLRG